MAMMTQTLSKAAFVFDKNNNRYLCEGNWSIINLKDLVQQFLQSAIPASKKLIISGEKLSAFDSAGALALMQCIDELKTKNNHVTLMDFNEQQQKLFDLLEDKRDILDYSPPPPKKNTLIMT